ncbi:unnamed protein product [Moneuplotes crassus]|uniref:Uncharacterized protein n=1 Tax=Euplotes crassus TaxID=5936 RepID=A0AAD1XNX7_EUPCR|nr:unnamed protein product [Moneuplotes crassus]
MCKSMSLKYMNKPQSETEMNRIFVKCIKNSMVLLLNYRSSRCKLLERFVHPATHWTHHLCMMVITSIANQHQRSKQKQHPIAEQIKNLYQSVFVKASNRSSEDEDQEELKSDQISSDEFSDLHSFDPGASSDNSSDDSFGENGLFKSASSQEINTSQVSMSSEDGPIFEPYHENHSESEESNNSSESDVENESF